jgi:hypothetical protein
MKPIIVSYQPGMFGEFFVSLVHASGKDFYHVPDLATTESNRVLFPNYLAAIDLDVKTFPSNKEWPVTIEQVAKLESTYGDQSFCVPTHWFNNISMTNLPCKGVRLHSSDLEHIDRAYCLSWIKSNISDLQAWPARRKEIEDLISSGHQYSHQLTELLDADRYENWKFLAYKLGILINGQADLEHYIRTRYKWYKTWSTTKYDGWFYFDIGQLICGNRLNQSIIEQHLSISIDQDAILSYNNKNLAVLEKEIGVSNDWISLLIEQCKRRLK